MRTHRPRNRTTLRRKNWCSWKKGEDLKITAVGCRAHLLPEMHCPDERYLNGRDRCLWLRAPKRVGAVAAAGDPVEPEAAEEEPEEVYDDATSVPMSTHYVQHWRCAYRQQEPENLTASLDATVRRLQRKSKGLEPVMPRVPKAARHMPTTVEAGKKRASDRSKAFTAWQRGQRGVAAAS